MSARGKLSAVDVGKIGGDTGNYAGVTAVAAFASMLIGKGWPVFTDAEQAIMTAGLAAIIGAAWSTFNRWRKVTP